MNSLIIASLLLMTACLTTGKDDGAKVHETSANWYAGDVAEAMAESKAHGVPVFLYWGAEWCPACNELKMSVFSDKRFVELMNLVIPVYLDGDDLSAQDWGETLQVASYPTMLFLDSSGQEILRFTESMTIDEFEAVFRLAMVQSQPFAAVLQRASRGRATSAEWRLLAHASWNDARDLDLHSREVFEMRKNLANKIPSHLQIEKGLLSAKLLEAAVEAQFRADESSRAIVESIRQDATKYLDAVFASSEIILAARMTILHHSAEILSFAFPEGGDERTIWRKRWLHASEQIGRNVELSNETRLWSLLPSLQLHWLEHDEAPLPPSIVQSVVQATRMADQKAGGPLARRAVIPAAAFLLQLSDELDLARELLLRELPQSDTPWMILSSLARIEEHEGNTAEALRWSALAREQAVGHASRIQWSVAYIIGSLRAGELGDQWQVTTAVRDLHTMLFESSDAFAGRNWMRLQALQSALLPWHGRPDLADTLQTDQSRCAELTSELATQRCLNYFQKLLQI